jgi:carboxymethylenebutenolidase
MPTPIVLINADDGFMLQARFESAQGERRGAVIVAQEIFGLTAHIDDMCARFAAAGYDALAPGLFERIERDFLAPMDAEGIAKGRAAVEATPWAQAVGDVQAAIDWIAARGGGAIHVTGFCYGGAAAWAAAGRCAGLTAASCFYGRLITSLLDTAPQVPTILHYGAQDAAIPITDVDAVRAAFPEIPVHIYEAGHGFCRRDSADFAPAACAAAVGRTIAHFEAHTAR